MQKFIFVLSVVCLSGCGAFATRPAKQMAYAESAFQAASNTGAETLAPQFYQVSRDTLLRARAAYRSKNFKEARNLAIRTRRMAEEAELKALRSEKNADSLNVVPSNGKPANE